MYKFPKYAKLISDGGTVRIVLTLGYGCVCVCVCVCMCVCVCDRVVIN